MTYCPACAEAGVPTCSDGLGNPVHIGAILAEMGLEPVVDGAVSEADRGIIGAQVKTAPRAGCANSRLFPQGLADADWSAN